MTPEFISANGLRFAVDSAGEGDAVALCLHGFPEARIGWRAQLPVLAAAGWRAVAPDLRGYGDSDRPQGVGAYRIERLVEDVAQMFDALGARRRLLVGHDWGGAIAWAFAIQQARPLDGLVILNAPHPAVFRQALAQSWAQRARSWYMAAFQLPWLPETVLTAGRGAGVAWAIRSVAGRAGVVPPQAMAVYRKNACRPGAMTAMIDYYRANLSGLGRATAALPRIETPTLVVWGEADKALGLELTQGLEAHVADLTVRRLPGVSHWVQHEAPEAVNASLSDWLASRGLALPGQDAASR
jgi:pimeloyl-ACP methyl ester carboxylesterase